MIVVYHNVHSQIKLEEFARTVFAYDVDLFVVSKATGVAAQGGIPYVSRLAFEKNKKVLIVKDIFDAVELLKPKKIYLVTDDVEKEINFKDIDSSTMIVFFGSYPVDRERELGECVTVKRDASEIAEVGIVLEKIKDQSRSTL